MSLCQKPVWGGAFASLWLIVAVVACAALEARAQSTGSSAEAERLRGAYPGVSLHYPHRAAWAGAEQVYGRPMPVGGRASESASLALSDWLDEHAAVFVGLGDVARFDFEILGEAPLHNGRVVVRFAQRIADPRNPQQHLKVYGVHGRALAREAVGGYMLNYVSCAALDVPSGGLATPTISAEAAKAIAATQSAASERRAMAWREPELVAMGAGLRAENPREARPAWRVGGADTENWLAMFDVFVDGLTGTILAEWDAGPAGICGLCASEEDPDQPTTPGLHHAARRLAHQHRGGGETDSTEPKVKGYVRGDVLQGFLPYVTQLACVPSTPDTDLAGLPRFLVELLDTPAGTVLASTRTDEDGYYEIFTNANLTQSSRVRFTPEHEFYKMAVITDVEASVFPPVLIFEWNTLLGVEKAIPVSGEADYTYENNRGFGTTEEYEIADSSAYTIIDATRLFVRSRLPGQTHFSGLDDQDLVVITTDDVVPSVDGVGFIRGAFYATEGLVAAGSDPMFGPPTLIMTAEGDCECSGQFHAPNYAYSTVVSHEYGHYMLDAAFGIELLSNAGIHEGYADLVSILFNGTDTIGDAGLGCIDSSTTKPIRDWVELDTTPWDPSARNCDSSPYIRGEQLVLVWRAIRDDGRMSPEEVYQLFVDWSLLATAEPSPRYCEQIDPSYTSRDRSARDATFLAVLIADDDNNDLSDGTPNSDVICAAFAKYFLPENEMDPDPCAERVHCAADLTADGVFDMFDILLLQRWIDLEDPRADLNGDGAIDHFDMLHLLNLSLSCS